ncbi:MAG: TIGR01777 family protein [Bacteroidales bacterium]|nr:TIGR01777 family protein [Bacteroidales bacterium]
MRIFITGGTGLIGRALIDQLYNQGHQITVLTRNVSKAKLKLGNKVKFCPTLDSLTTLDDYEAVINLAGERIIGKRWSQKQKEKLCASRWNITGHLTKLINKSNNPPQVFISGSAVGYYGAQGENKLTEDSLPHDELVHQLCKKWEKLALDAQSNRTRVCISRTGIVLSKEGGMLPLMLPPFRFGLGTIFGTGKQYISWIHIQDMVNGIIFLLNTFDAEGIFNFTAPNPTSNKLFADTLATSLVRPRIFRIPSFLLKMTMGEMSTMVIDGQRVVPEHLKKLNFHFDYEHLNEAFKSMI